MTYAIWIQTGVSSIFARDCGYLTAAGRPGHSSEAVRFGTPEEAGAEIARRGLTNDTSVRPGVVTAYAVYLPAVAP